MLEKPYVASKKGLLNMKGTSKTRGFSNPWVSTLAYQGTKMDTSKPSFWKLSKVTQNSAQLQAGEEKGNVSGSLDSELLNPWASTACIVPSL
jgi:hypothetical protein